MKLVLLAILAIISTSSAFVPSRSVGNFARAAPSFPSECISECNKLTVDIFEDPSICEVAKDALPDRRGLHQCNHGKQLASLYACNALCESDSMKSNLISVSVAKECNRRVGGVGAKSRWCNHGYRYFLRNVKAAFTGSNIVGSPKDNRDVPEDMMKEVTVAAANIGVEEVEIDEPNSPSTIYLEDASRKESTKEVEKDTVEKTEQGISLYQSSQEFVGLPTSSKLFESYDVSHSSVYNSLDEEKNPLVGVDVTSSLNWKVPPGFIESTHRDYNSSLDVEEIISIPVESVMIEPQDVVWLLNHSQSSATPSFFRPPPWSSLVEGGIGQAIGASAHSVGLPSNASAFCNSSAINLLGGDSIMLYDRNATVQSPSEEAKYLHFDHVLLPENIWGIRSSRHRLLGFGGASPNKACASSYDDGDGPNHHWSQVECSNVARTSSSSPTWCDSFVPIGGMCRFIALADQPPTSIRPTFEAKGLVEIKKISLALLIAAFACYNDFFGSKESTTSDDDSELFLGCNNDVEDSPADGMKQLLLQTKPRCLLSSDLGPYWNSTLPSSRYRRRSLRHSHPPDRFIPSF